MEEVGVEAVVKGLQAFLGDMKQVNGALDGLRPSATALQTLFETVGSAILGFGREVLNVAEIALGTLLRDAINGIIGLLGDLVQAIFETGDEFQRMKIRLTGLNLNETSDGVKSFTQAMSEAQAMTQKELEWLQNLGAATPFDPKQIADTYTQARAFGFTADEAQRLTRDIIDFTASMGLSNETLFLIIQNLGQMVQRGKITGTEIRDLARGSFLPLNDVLQRIAKNMGITVAELTKKISTPAGVPASEFVKAFEQMVEEEPRFIGAAGRLSRALVPAFNNVKELFTSIFGLNVATPIFDILGNKVASLVDQFVFFNQEGDLIKTQKWNDLVTAAQNLGQALSQLISQLLGFVPTADTFANAMISGIQGLATWIGQNREAIIGFFTSMWNAVMLVVDVFNRIVAWVVENKDLILGFFTALWDIIGQVLSNLFGGTFAKGDVLGGILDAVKNFMQFVIDNKDKIAEWATVLLKVWLVMQVLMTAFNIFIGILIAIGGFVLSVVGVIISLITTLATFGTAIIAVVGFTSALIDMLVLIPALLTGVQLGVDLAVKSITSRFQEFFDTVTAVFNYFKLFFAEGDPFNDWLSQMPQNVQVAVLTVVQWLTNLQIAFATFVGQFINLSNGPSNAAKYMTDNITSSFGTLGNVFLNFPSVVLNMILGVSALFITLRTNVTTAVNGIADRIRGINWFGVGSSIIQGMANGIMSGIGTLINAAVSAAQAAYNAAMSFLQGGSPSKLFEQVGLSTMQGMAIGIQKYSALATSSMNAAMQKVSVPAVTMPGIIQSVVAQGLGNVSNSTNTQNYNLTVNSSANAEPIIQDFNMMGSLAGA